MGIVRSLRAFHWGIAFAAAVLATGCATSPPQARQPTVPVTTLDRLANVDVKWVGTYKVKTIKRIPTPGAVGSAISHSDGIHDMVETNRVSMDIGSGFGMTVAFPGLKKDEFARVLVRWTFPPPGLRDPNLRGPATAQLHTLECWGDCRVAWTLTEPWEMVPGVWKAEILVEGRTVASRAFDVE